MTFFDNFLGLFWHVWQFFDNIMDNFLNLFFWLWHFFKKNIFRKQLQFILKKRIRQDLILLKIIYLCQIFKLPGQCHVICQDSVFQFICLVRFGVRVAISDKKAVVAVGAKRLLLLERESWFQKIIKTIENVS